MADVMAMKIFDELGVAMTDALAGGWVSLWTGGTNVPASLFHAANADYSGVDKPLPPEFEPICSALMIHPGAQLHGLAAHVGWWQVQTELDYAQSALRVRVYNGYYDLDYLHLISDLALAQSAIGAKQLLLQAVRTGMLHILYDG